MMQLFDKIRLVPELQFVVFLVCSIALVALTQFFGLGAGMSVLFLLVAGLTIVIIYLRPLYSLHVMITVAFFLFFIQRMFKLYDLPLGVVVEAISFFTLIILLLKKELGGGKNIVGYLLLAWLALNVIEFFNPKAASRIAWFYAFRGVLNISVIYFLAFSCIRSKANIRSVIQYWIILSLLAAFYCLYQEYHGFPDFDMAWINASEERFNLLFTWGRLRKFSFFSGPTELGLILTYALMMTFGLFFYYHHIFSKLLLLLVSGVLLFALVQTGSRTSTILLPIGLVMFVALNLRKEVVLTIGILFFVGLLVVLAPTKNASIFVMRTAFETSEDRSYNVRLINQERINPYILSSPLGYGLGSTGDWGSKFSPETFVGSFPPDSEYVKIAIETGWIGLVFWAIILFLIFRHSIVHYFQRKDGELKLLISIFVSIYYMYLVAQYPQEAFRVPSTTILFAMTLGIIAKIKDLEK